MKTLVTGGAGFIGSHVVRCLAADGHEVRVLHLPGEDLRNLAGLEVERLAGDVTDPEDVRRAVADRDWVFHLAAVFALWLPRPERMREVNVGGTRTVLRACADAGVAKVVYTSSIAVFGGQGRDRDATEASRFALGASGDLYSRTKYESHRVAREWARDLDVTIVAPCGPIGPGDVGPTPTGRLLLAAANLPAMIVLDSASNFADVRAMARAHVTAAHRGRRGESYLLGSENLRLTQLAALVTHQLGVRRPVVRVPAALARPAARLLVARAERTGHPPLFTPAAIEIARLGLRADCARAARELDMPQGSIAGAVRDALIWFAQNGYVSDRRVARRLASLAA